MSNQQVGAIYQSIISDVIDASRVDFEEGGVDDAVLERLRLGWQRKLTQLNVATFPWDPKPEPPPIANPPTVPSNVGNYNHNPPPPQHQQQQQQQQYQGGHGLSLPMSQGQPQTQQPRIKPEPEDPNLIQQPLINIPGATNAQQRAAQHLQNNYGQRAAASINAIQNTAGGGAAPQHAPSQPPQQGPPNPQLQYQPHAIQNQQQQQQQQQQQMHLQQQQRPQGVQNPGQPQGQGQPQQMTQAQAQAQYRAMLARDAANRQAQLQQQQPAIKQAQNDGAGDEVEAIQYDAVGNEIAMGRVEIDGMIRQKILSMGQSMEGGGLMVSLKEASSKAKHQGRSVKKTVGGAVGGGDAADDDDDNKDDEDAINSDLDDPDDGLNEDEDEDDNMGHIMLCMYDKVQRVKNKWKCVMKDGVLTVNGKEYVFHKASGEYEW